MKKSSIIICVLIIPITVITVCLGFYITNKKESEENFQKNNDILIEKDSMNLVENSKNTSSDIKNEIENENIVEENNLVIDEKNENDNAANENNEDVVVNIEKDKEIQEFNNIQDEKTNESEEEKIQYIEGFEVVGNMKIPKYNVDAPIFRNVALRTLEISVAVAYGSLNESGNTTIFGHAYKDYPFEKISSLENGDIIIIKDSKNREITYEVYDKQIINSQDATYMIRDTNGAKEISMQTGAPDNNKLIVLAREINAN